MDSGLLGLKKLSLSTDPSWKEDSLVLKDLINFTYHRFDESSVLPAELRDFLETFGVIFKHLGFEGAVVCRPWLTTDDIRRPLKDRVQFPQLFVLVGGHLSDFVG